ncbi:MAG: type II toxin-antitoxin system RelE/ParE family toxin [Erythrobacter sp.]|nr:type II toxin-antitoxin system RelE/ParE family toxin [Erythrobacter sp.]MDJ0978650.1 type II toxin-antitoxin system RelE/ParE family toxin [Erythrobacter sp.]
MKSNKAKLIRAKIEAFAEDPDVTHPNVTKLKGRPEYRLRVQDWRVIFLLEDNLALVRDIGPRGSIYE